MQCRAENAYTTLLKATTAWIPSEIKRFGRASMAIALKVKQISYEMANCQSSFHLDFICIGETRYLVVQL
ncbi:MAG: hypothetical protein CLLPBCKN_007423 [Chroococcidiopsis cubana SAG 39.79]|nr:hypothetical protein [Chroococcidiopsis cubana SAG 39.79]